MKLLHCFVNTRLPWASHARRIQDDKISHSTCSASRPVTSVAVSLFCASLPIRPYCELQLQTHKQTWHWLVRCRSLIICSIMWSGSQLDAVPVKFLYHLTLDLRRRCYGCCRVEGRQIKGDTDAATTCRLHTLILLTHWCQWSCCNLLTLGGKKKNGIRKVTLGTDFDAQILHVFPSVSVSCSTPAKVCSCFTAPD